MSTAAESLGQAATRLDEVSESARSAASALDGVSDRLTERAMDVSRRAEELQASVVRARDALDSAGA